MSPYHRAGALLPGYALASMLARRHLGPRLTCGELATLPCHRQADTDGFGAPRCSSFLSAPDGPIGQILCEVGQREELSYRHRPSLRGVRDCAGHGRPADAPWPCTVGLLHGARV